MSFYGSAAAFTTYSEARSRTILAAWTTAVIEAALLISSEWLDDRYDSVWTGYATDGFTQTRRWPRASASTNTYPQYIFADTETPDNVDSAVYEAAFRELTTPGALRADFTSSKYMKVAISGALAVEYDNSNNSADVQLQIPIIDSLMAPLLDENSQGSFSSLSGKVSRI